MSKSKKQKGLSHRKSDLEIEHEKGKKEGRDEAFDEINAYTVGLVIWILTQHYSFTDEQAADVQQRFMDYSRDIREKRVNFRELCNQIYRNTGIEIIEKERG